jgi:uncharacterized protein with von Willebrand factor type A (vWA) domain
MNKLTNQSLLDGTFLEFSFSQQTLVHDLEKKLDHLDRITETYIKRIEELKSSQIPISLCLNETSPNNNDFEKIIGSKKTLLKESEKLLEQLSSEKTRAKNEFLAIQAYINKRTSA